MGVFSRRILPVCGNLCICCPALRSRSRQPIKRYKKLLAEIFPKTLEGAPNERKIVKLCEYAALNPLRIPKIAKYLEQRCSKELRSEHIKYISIITDIYHNLLCKCKGQMAYFSLSLLNVVVELLDCTKQEAVQILGCKTLTRFIHSQTDGTYAHNIEKLVHKVCLLARESGKECTKCCLRASSLQCLSAMVWFMAEFTHALDNFDEIVYATLDNYEPHIDLTYDNQTGEPHHNWVGKVVKCEARNGAHAHSDLIPSYIRLRQEKKEYATLTREEIENPKIWAQICVQKMAELAKENTTMHWVLGPMFSYFDKGKHWIPQHGLAMVILSDMCYFADAIGNEELILAAVIRHLDHKNVAHDLKIKSDIIQIATALVRQLRTRTIVSEIGIVSDLCRHLRKSIQATVESVGQQELNTSLQISIEGCLLEIARTGDAQPLHDLMVITLEKLPRVGVVARATIGSLFILAHVISFASMDSYPKRVFPEALLCPLLKTMMHPDIEVRVGAHQIFAVILVPSSSNTKHDLASIRSANLYETRKWQYKTALPFASAAALLEKLQKESSVMVEKHENDNQNVIKDTESGEEEWKQCWACKNSTNFYMMSSSTIERSTEPVHLPEIEQKIVELSEDQTAQLLSGFWIQANLTDNLPSNFEAIAHSFSLTLIASCLKSTNHNLVRFFQLPISLQNISLGPSDGMLSSCQRSLFTVATGMLMFAAKIYVPDLNDLLKSVVCNHVDPFLSISDDLQLHVKPQADVKEYGSAADNLAASSSLSKVRETVHESGKVILDVLVGSLSKDFELDAEDVPRQLSAAFTPDEAIVLGPQSDFQANSPVEDDVISDSSLTDTPSFIPKVPTSPCLSHVTSVEPLLESASGQVAGTSVSILPLPYRTVASQCEALGTGSRMKLSSWLANEMHDSRPVDQLSSTLAANDITAIQKVSNDFGQVPRVLPTESSAVLRLPPASPFDNFLKAAGFQGN